MNSVVQVLASKSAASTKVTGVKFNSARIRDFTIVAVWLPLAVKIRAAETIVLPVGMATLRNLAAEPLLG